MLESLEKQPPSTNETNRALHFRKIRKHRVRLYAVNDECWWDYKGTGHVICIFDTEPVQAFYLIVRSEDDNSVLFKTKITMLTTFKIMRETLIVRYESASYSLALSFKEKAGCEEIWHKICQIKSEYPSRKRSQEVATCDCGNFAHYIEVLELRLIFDKKETTIIGPAGLNYKSFDDALENILQINDIDIFKSNTVNTIPSVFVFANPDVATTNKGLQLEHLIYHLIDSLARKYETNTLAIYGLKVDNSNSKFVSQLLDIRQEVATVADMPADKQSKSLAGVADKQSKSLAGVADVVFLPVENETFEIDSIVFRYNNKTKRGCITCVECKDTNNEEYVRNGFKQLKADKKFVDKILSKLVGHRHHQNVHKVLIAPSYVDTGGVLRKSHDDVKCLFAEDMPNIETNKSIFEQSNWKQNKKSIKEWLSNNVCKHDELHNCDQSMSKDIYRKIIQILITIRTAIYVKKQESVQVVDYSMKRMIHQLSVQIPNANVKYKYGDKYDELKQPSYNSKLKSTKKVSSPVDPDGIKKTLKNKLKIMLLTTKQLDIWELKDPKKRRLIVCGMAGTGKTLLLIGRAIELAANGERVLILIPESAMGYYDQTLLQSCDAETRTRIEVTSFDAYAARLADSTKSNVDSSTSVVVERKRMLLGEVREHLKKMQPPKLNANNIELMKKGKQTMLCAKNVIQHLLSNKFTMDDELRAELREMHPPHDSLFSQFVRKEFTERHVLIDDICTWHGNLMNMGGQGQALTLMLLEILRLDSNHNKFIWIMFDPFQQRFLFMQAFNQLSTKFHGDYRMYFLILPIVICWHALNFETRSLNESMRMTYDVFQSADNDYKQTIENAFGHITQLLLDDVVLNEYRCAHRVCGWKFTWNDAPNDMRSLAIYLKRRFHDDLKVETDKPDSRNANEPMQYHDIAILDTTMSCSIAALRQHLSNDHPQIACGTVNDKSYQQKLCVDEYQMAASYEWKCVIVIVSDSNPHKERIYFAKSRCQICLVILKLPIKVRS